MSTLRLYFDLGGDSGRYLHQLCDKFEQQHGVEIQRTNLEIHVLQEQLPRGHDLPEMALLPSDMISWADTLQLSAIPAQWQLPEISSLCLATLQHQSLQLGIPVLAGNHLLLFYDKRRDVPPKDWQTVLTNNHNNEHWCCGIDFEEPYWLIPFLLRFFGWPIGQKCLHLNSPAMQHALQLRQLLQRRNRLRHYHFDGELSQALVNGEVPAIISGEWEYAALQQALGEHLGVAPLPSYQGLSCRSFFSTIGLVFPGLSLQGPHAPLLQRFAQWLLAADNQSGWQHQARRHPACGSNAASESLPDWQTIELSMDECCVMPNHQLMNQAWQAMAYGLKGCNNLPLRPPGRLGQQMQHFTTLSAQRRMQS